MQHTCRMYCFPTKFKDLVEEFVEDCMNIAKVAPVTITTLDKEISFTYNENKPEVVHIQIGLDSVDVFTEKGAVLWVHKKLEEVLGDLSKY